MAAATSSVIQVPTYETRRTVGKQFDTYRIWLFDFVNARLKKEGRLDPKIYSAINLHHAIENVFNVLAAHQNSLVSSLAPDLQARVSFFSPLIEGFCPPNELDPKDISVAALNIIHMNIIPGWLPKVYGVNAHLVFQENKDQPAILPIYGRFKYAVPKYTSKNKKLIPTINIGGQNISPLCASETQLKFDVTPVRDKFNLSSQTYTIHEGRLAVTYLNGTTELQTNTTETSYYNLRILAYPTQIGEIKAYFVEKVLDKTVITKYTSGTFSFDGRTYTPSDTMREERFTIRAETDCIIDLSNGKKIDVVKLKGCSGTFDVKTDPDTFNRCVNVVVSLRTKQTEGDTDDRGVVEFQVKFDQLKRLYKDDAVPQQIKMGWNEEQQVNFSPRVVTKLEYKPFNRKASKPAIPIEGDYQGPYLTVKKMGEAWTLKTPNPVPFTPIQFQ